MKILYIICALIGHSKDTYRDEAFDRCLRCTDIVKLCYERVGHLVFDPDCKRPGCELHNAKSTMHSEADRELVVKKHRDWLLSGQGTAPSLIEKSGET